MTASAAAPPASAAPSSRKLALALAASTLLVLLASVAVSLSTGASQEAHERVALPAEYAAALLRDGNALRLVVALDVAFLALYTGFFAAFSRYLAERGRPFVRLALGFLVTATALDIVENHHILAMLDAAGHGALPSAAELTAQQTLSASKFTSSYVALVLFGVALPRTSRLGWALSAFLTVGTLTSAVIGYALPLASQAAFDAGRWVGFALGFVLAIAWLREQPETSAG